MVYRDSQTIGCCKARWTARTMSAVMLAFMLVLTAGTPSLASEVSMTATVNKTEATLQDRLILTLTISGTRGAPEPELPSLEPFDVESLGRSQSRTYSFGTGTSAQASVKTTYRYALTPRGTGDFTIGPARVKIGRVLAESEPIQVHIGQVAPLLSETPRDIFVTASVDTTTPYVGQQIVFTFRFYRRVSVDNIHYQPPSTKGFWTTDLGHPPEYRRVMNGQEYLVSEVNQALFPLQTGKLTIGSAGITCDILVRDRHRHRRSIFDDFFDADFFGFSRFRRHTKHLRAEPVEVDARPLPEVGRPDDFSGAVGRISLTSDVSATDLKVGEDSTLTIVVQDEGNIGDVPEPTLPELEDVKIYRDKPSTDSHVVGNKIVGKKVYKIALVPEKPGEYVIPAFTIPHFNPDIERYQRARTKEIVLRVSPGPEEQPLPLSPGLRAGQRKEEIRVLATDILPIHTGGLDEGSNWAIRYLPAILVMPAIMYAGCLLSYKRSQRMKTDTAYYRARKAGRNARRKLRAAAVVIKRQAGDREAACTALSKALTEFLADKLGVSAAGMTARDAEDYLLARMVPEELISEVVSILEVCDFGRFATGAQDAQDTADLVKRTTQIVSELDRRLQE